MFKDAKQNETGPDVADEQTPLVKARGTIQMALAKDEEWTSLCVDPTVCDQENDEMHVESIRNRARRWSCLSKKLNRSLKFWGYFNLILQIAGAALSTLATQLPNMGWIVGIAGGLCLTFVPVISSSFLGPAKAEKRVRTRNVAENLKSEYYLYLAKVHPYDDKSTRFKVLLERVQDCQQSVSDVRALYALTKLADVKEEEMPPTKGRRGYVSARLNVEYQNLRKKARYNADIGMLLTRIQYTLGGVAALIGMLAGSAGGANYVVNDATDPSAQAIFVEFVSTKLGAWAAVFATATAAISSSITMGKYFELAAIFSESAQKLEDLFLLAHEQHFFEDQSQEWYKKEWSVFVLDCEEIIAQENYKWENIFQMKGPSATRSESTTSFSASLDVSSRAPSPTSDSGKEQAPVSTSEHGE